MVKFPLTTSEFNIVVVSELVTDHIESFRLDSLIVTPSDDRDIALA